MKKQAEKMAENCVAFMADEFTDFGIDEILKAIENELNTSEKAVMILSEDCVIFEPLFENINRFNVKFYSGLKEFYFSHGFFHTLLISGN